jgi:putative transposase
MAEWAPPRDALPAVTAPMLDARGWHRLSAAYTSPLQPALLGRMSVRRSRTRHPLQSPRPQSTLTHMSKRRVFDTEYHAQFVTFSCYRRRRLLDHARLRDDFVEITADKLRDHGGVCSGFVVMPNHIHAILWFRAANSLSPFMKIWKQTTSIRLKRVLRGVAPNYASTIPPSDPFWQPKYYPFNLFTSHKALEPRTRRSGQPGNRLAPEFSGILRTRHRRRHSPAVDLR